MVAPSGIDAVTENCYSRKNQLEKSALSLLFQLFVSVTVGVIATALYEALIKDVIDQRRATKPTRQFWNFIDEEVRLVLSAHLIDRGPQSVKWVSWGDVSAYHRVEAFLRARIRAYGRRVTLVPSDDPLEKTRHLVMLGGPFTSLAARNASLMIYDRLNEESKKHFPCPAGFWKGRFDSPSSKPSYDTNNIPQGVNSQHIENLSDLVICNREGANSMEPSYDYSTQTGSDFGVVIKCDNPEQPGKCIVMLYGISDRSTDAVTEFATRDDQIRFLIGHGAGNIWGIVEVRYERGNKTGLVLISQGTMVFEKPELA